MVYSLTCISCFFQWECRHVAPEKSNDLPHSIKVSEDIAVDEYKVIRKQNHKSLWKYFYMIICVCHYIIHMFMFMYILGNETTSAVSVPEK